jgi:hypothetical protein
MIIPLWISHRIFGILGASEEYSLECHSVRLHLLSLTRYLISLQSDLVGEEMSTETTHAVTNQSIPGGELELVGPNLIYME